MGYCQHFPYSVILLFRANNINNTQNGGINMKKLITYLVLAAVLVSATVAFAQGALPGSGWWSGEQIQNVGSSDANVTVTAYDKSSSTTYNATTTIASGAAFTFTPNNFTGMPDGFQGSAVASADQPIKAIVNITNRQSGSLGVGGGKAAAQYQGIGHEMVDTTLYFPLAKGDHYGKTTTFYIQNAGSSAATATATFVMRNGDTHTYTTPSIGPNQMVAFSVFDATSFNPSTNDGKVGNLMVTSTQPLAGTVVEHFTTEAVATIAQGTRGFTLADFDTKAYAPVIKNSRFNRFTGIQVQNVSSGNINITVKYAGTAGSCAGNSYTDTATAVVPGASYTFIQLPGHTNLPSNCTASATIEATDNIVAIVNEAYVSTYVSAGHSQRAVTSSAISAGSATTKISIPLFKDDRFSKRTGLQIQNIGSAQASNIVATFVCSGGSSFTAISKPQTVNAGAAVLFYHPSTQGSLFTSGNPFASANVNCSVTVTSDQPIVAIANESVTPGASFEQDNNNYEGFNLAP